MIVAGVACVEIATGPGGVASIRRTPSPRAIILDDVLRDSTGAPTPLRPIAYSESGAPVDSAPFRFVALPISSDTTTNKPVALIVDSVTGTVRAASTWLDDSGRVATTLGARLQLLDTFVVVPRPHTLTRPIASATTPLRPDTSTLFYDCRVSDDASLGDDSLATAVAYQGARYGNVKALASRTLIGDSVAGDTMVVRRYLVRYVIESVGGRAATSIPTVTLPSGARRPVIGVIARGNGVTSTPDNPINFDTTDGSGVTAPRLRIFPRALAAAYTAVADTAIRVVLRAIARTSPTATVVDSGIVVTLRRFTRNPIDNAVLTCPAP